MTGFGGPAAGGRRARVLRATRRAAVACVLGAASLACAASISAAQGERPTFQFTVKNDPVLTPVPIEALLPKRPGTPLSPEQQQALAEARKLRRGADLPGAQRALQKLLAATPHHPAVLEELAGVLLDREDALGVERLARTERLAAKDSLLLAGPLVTSLQMLSRPRDAAKAALEAWIVSAVAEGWARDVIERSSELDARGTREVMRLAWKARPERTDLARQAARLDWAANDLRSALATLGESERLEGRSRLRSTFAEELIATGAARDSGAAIEVFLALAGDKASDAAFRSAAARRAWDLAGRRGEERALAPRVHDALADLDPARWSVDLRLGVARQLSSAGRSREAREVLGTAAGAPELELERALTDLREGPPERALPSLRALAERLPVATLSYAEALFFSGALDSAHVWFDRASKGPDSDQAGAALERLYLLEEQAPRAAILAAGKLSYEQWRGNTPRANALADSLFSTLARGPLWTDAGLRLAEMRSQAGNLRGALVPLLAIADSLPDDRRAPLASQRAGDALLKLGDERAALARYEDCLARYPRAWNAPEVRRRVDRLRRDRRF